MEQIKKGDEYVFFCLKCEHKKPKLSVNLSTDWFHCWACNFSGKTIIALLPKGSQEKKEYISELQNKTNVCKIEEKKYDIPVLPKEFRTLTKSWNSPYYKTAIEYLKVRGIDYKDIFKWKLGYCEDGEYNNRIIIPSFDDYGSLNFFVGRSYYDSQLKYKHGNFCKDIIFNDYMIDWNSSIVVTEGPFDAFKASDNVVALQGSIFNEDSKLFSKIIMSDIDVYFAMDKDAFKKQFKIIEMMFSYGVLCHYVGLMGKKDVGEMTKDEFAEAKQRSMLVSCSADLLKLRVIN